jgi:YHS domain-containing protein
MKLLRARSQTLGITILLATALLAAVSRIAAASSTTPVNPVNTADGIALKGYDPVAYFTTGQPARGTDAFTDRWKGATYRFASAENRELFRADPERYLPQYGGYCAYAMSLNRIADIDPERWKIVEGKLYLNNGRFSHTLWSFDIAGHIASADRNWPVYPKTTRASVTAHQAER